ncbi:MAG: DmsC/YnfH family molybdoenzyme membrane anchor subunit [Betaproteobacteria bacterium]
MKPAFSVISFTTLAGAAQGLVVTLAVSVLTGVPVSARFITAALACALVMLGVGLGASFLHLGRPERAWRAMAMWRTSWLSREVIVLPVFMGLVFLWAGITVWGPTGDNSRTVTLVLAMLALAGAALLWWCTGQIYACLRFIQEWAHPMTVVNFTLVGLSTGLVLGCALAATLGERAALAEWAPRALAATLAAWGARAWSLHRNARLKPKSTAQSATGIASAKLAQKSMGMSAGAFNTREFFHGATQAAIGQVRRALHVLGFGLPAGLMIAALTVAATMPTLAPVPASAHAALPGLVIALWWATLASQVPGILAERWLFFAQARHPQNLYYQAVS